MTVSLPLPVPAPAAVARFDSASAMLRALSRFLSGRDFRLGGVAPPALQPLVGVAARGLELLPRRLRQEAYAVSGWAEAVPPPLLAGVSADRLAEWVVSRYPRRRYPGVLLGASNGAAVHLAAALGVPWLPQTLLLPVRQRGHADDPARDLVDGTAPGRLLLDANDDLQLHHMHDANQDRLMIRGMTYFRVKLRALPAAYRRFLAEQVEPGGDAWVLDCRLRWPTTSVGDRHVFQHGALGGLDPQDYQRAPHSPTPDGTSPEAEWGYEPALDESVVQAGRDLRLRWLRFGEPEDLSPLVAELHREWYRRLGRPDGRLLAESFFAIEPYWALRTASAPFWTAFATERSLGRLTDWLDAVEPFDEIRMTLFPHGTPSAGIARPEHWRAVLDRAVKIGVLLGADEGRFPTDFGALVRYQPQLAAVRHRFDLPPPLRFDEVAQIVRERGGRHGVRLETGPGPSTSPA